jgi:hypothetical protein
MRVTAYIYYPISDPLSPDIDPALSKLCEELPKLATSLGAVGAVIADATIINSDDDSEEVIF